MQHAPLVRVNSFSYVFGDRALRGAGRQPAWPSLAPGATRAAKRVFDVACASIGLIVAAPFLAIAAVGIRVSDPGPILFRARRVGVGGRVFTMYKLRTMRVHDAARHSPITARDDGRIFPFGAWLRRAKLDELPQLVNVLRGEMSIIGPRPEDPAIVDAYYAPLHRETLRVRPGLAGPGSLLHDSCGDAFLGGDDPVPAYVTHLLPIKLALDLVYVRNVSLWYDLRLVGRTVAAVLRQTLRLEARGEPPEMRAAAGFIVPARSRAGNRADRRDDAA